MSQNATIQPETGKPLTAAGILLIACGLLHIPVWLIDASPWEGSVSWRKPILFGVSTGMTLWSLGWLAKNLTKSQWRSIDHTLSWIISVTLVLEVGLITVQQWRGRASHFNQATTIDWLIDMTMLGLICIAFGGILYFAVRSFGRLNLAEDYSLALRSGIGFLVVSCIIGFVISSHGYQRVESGLSPGTLGESGVTKFPHGIAIHALQLLPFAVYLMRRFNISRCKRMGVIAWLSASFGMQVVFASYQTLNGYSRWELQSVLSIVLVLAVGICTVISVVIAGASEKNTI